MSSRSYIKFRPMWDLVENKPTVRGYIMLTEDGELIDVASDTIVEGYPTDPGSRCGPTPS